MPKPNSNRGRKHIAGGRVGLGNEYLLNNNSIYDILRCRLLEVFCLPTPGILLLMEYKGLSSPYHRGKRGLYVYDLEDHQEIKIKLKNNFTSEIVIFLSINGHN